MDTTYTLHIRYDSPDKRPLVLWLDGQKVGKCCGRVTGNSLPYPYRRPKVHDAQPRPVSNRHGAEWEEAGRLPLTKGKHTLKLTRTASSPNVIAIRLESPVAFPKDWKPDGPELRLPEKQDGERFRYELGWKQDGPMAKVRRIPPVYRTAFLPPGSVNIATLQLALKDMITEFGPSYPKGPEYLKRLAELKETRKASAHHSPDETGVVEQALQSLRRETMLTHPLLSFERLLFVKRITLRSSHIYSDHWDGSETMGGNLCILSLVTLE